MGHSYRKVTVRDVSPADTAAISAIHQQSWGGPVAVAHGVAYDLRTLPTLVADSGDDVVGVVTYVIEGDSLEVVSIDAVPPGHGTGTVLLAAAVELARSRGLRRVWLITTNDNIDALRFYQRRGMRIAAVSPGAVDRSRSVKPSIPLVGAYGIPLRDELTLELLIDGG
jgi:ribosomal protein S18 acetylase RimI-like enzyme